MLLLRLVQLVHAGLARLYDAADDSTRRAGVVLVHGLGWPWSLANVAHDAAAGQFHAATVVGPVMLGVAALVQAAVAVDRWLVERAEKRGRRP